MARKLTVPKPTNAEFKILSVIWDRQSATVREVLNPLKQFEDIGYTLSFDGQFRLKLHWLYNKITGDFAKPGSSFGKKTLRLIKP